MHSLTKCRDIDVYIRVRNRTIKKHKIPGNLKLWQTSGATYAPFFFIIQCVQNMKKVIKRRPAQFVDDMTVIL